MAGILMAALPTSRLIAAEPIRIDQFRLLSDTMAELTVSGPTNRRYFVEISPDFTNWLQVLERAPNSIPPSGQFTVTFGLEGGPTNKFYRALYLEVVGGERVTALDGPDEDAAADHLPVLEIPFEQSADVVTLDGDHHISIVHLLATLNDQVTVAQINLLLNDENIAISGVIPGMGVVEFELLSPVDLTELLNKMATLESSGLFSAVAPNISIGLFDDPPQVSQLTLNNTAPPSDQFDWTWDVLEIGNGNGWNNAFELSRVPQAWNWLDYGWRQKGSHGGNHVTVLEFGFYGHSDLPTSASLIAGTNSRDEVRRHGNAVVGVIAARRDNTTGIQGVTPHAASIKGHGIIYSQNATNGPGAFESDVLKQFESLLKNGQTPAVYNYSVGKTWTNGNPVSLFVSTNTGQTWAQLMDMSGGVFANGLQSFNNAIGSDYILFCAAGNDANTFDARYTSAFANIACRTNLNTLVPNVVVVESVTGAGAKSFWSNLDLATVNGGTGNNSLAAGGDEVGLLSGPGDSFQQSSGTSYASPLVAGIASYVWNLAPSLSAEEVINILSNADNSQAADQGAPIVDMFAAILGVDLLLGNKDLQRALVDVDDGTLDGNLRDVAQYFEKDPDEIHHQDNRRGDGKIDMRDFRAFRDAWLHVSGITDFLDGLDTHFKRDQNFDGLVDDLAVFPEHPVSEIPTVSGGSVEPEFVFSRYDFNGNGSLDEETIMNEPPDWAVSPFKIDPDTIVLARDVDGGAFRDLDVLLDAELWELDEENVGLAELETPTFIQGAPPAGWSHTTVHRTNLIGGVLSVEYVPYLYSCDFHVEMESGDPSHPPFSSGGFLGTDGLWISSSFTLLAKGRMDAWQGVVTIPLPHPDYPVIPGLDTSPPDVLVQYKKTVGNEVHLYLLSLEPGPGEDITLTLGFDQFGCSSTKRDTDSAFWPRTGQTIEGIHRLPEQPPYQTQLIPASQVGDVAQIAKDMAHAEFDNRLLIPDWIGVPPFFEPSSKLVVVDTSTYRIELNGVVIRY